MITKVGKNLVRDLICGATTNVYINQAGLGTAGTDPTESDTGLNNNSNFGVSDTIKSVTFSTADKQVVFDYNLASTEGTGVTFREFGLSSSDANILFNRQTFYDLTHNNTEEWQISIAISIK